MLDGIARTLISVFDQADIVALGEEHMRRLDCDLRIALFVIPISRKRSGPSWSNSAALRSRRPWTGTFETRTYPEHKLEQVWNTTTQAANRIWDDPIYADFFAAIRDVNSRLPADARVRVFGGEPGPGDNRSHEIAAVSVLKEQVLQKHGNALVIYGAAHFYRTFTEDYLSSMGEDIGIARRLEIDYPGRTFVVIPVRQLERPRAVDADIAPDHQKFDRALKTLACPVLVSLQRSRFRDSPPWSSLATH